MAFKKATTKRSMKLGMKTGKKNAVKRAAGGSSAGKVMKVMKVMKAKKKKISIIARGRLARFLVHSGRKVKTAGGMTKESIEKNKRGRLVSKKQSAHGHKMYTNIRGWTTAFVSSRRQLNCQGFIAINGKTLLGKALYVRMRKLYDSGPVPDPKKEEVKSEREEQP